MGSPCPDASVVTKNSSNDAHINIFNPLSFNGYQLSVVGCRLRVLSGSDTIYNRHKNPLNRKPKGFFGKKIRTENQ
ncbi:hypothetical protein C6499_06125 [Candidatus Poribacteria bacterium]|nr:MAG: hypothetical protein C6499_06125 [Candidatus Poribacteria bacterium]